MSRKHATPKTCLAVHLRSEKNPLTPCTARHVNPLWGKKAGKHLPKREHILLHDYTTYVYSTTQT